MSPCDPQLLSAYLDDELSPEIRGDVEAHLRDCPTCAAELQSLREAARLIQQHPFDDLTDAELTRLHEAIDASAEQNVWRLGLVLSGLAASILIIGSAWLMELPAPSQQTAPMALAPAQPWERVAMTLRPDPMPLAGNDAIRLANADLADWMLQGLAGK